MTERTGEKKDYIKDYVDLYLDYNSGSRFKSLEYEVRFGTIGDERITKTQYDNVMKQLKSVGFHISPEFYTLKVQQLYTDKTTGREKQSNVRIEISGVQPIKEFCKSNSIVKGTSTPQNLVIKDNVRFLQKMNYNVTNKETGVEERVPPGNYPDFNFRVTLQQENKLSARSGIINQQVNEWTKKKKMFRLVNRIRASHPSYPGVVVDMSIVRSSARNTRGRMIPTYNMTQANVLQEPETYEIEIEYENIMYGEERKTVVKNIRTTITNILRGLQGTNFPVSYKLLNETKSDYLDLLYVSDSLIRPTRRRVYPRDFVGPSSISLEMKNITEFADPTESKIPNIRQPYTVTDKADGDRKLLFVNATGRLFLVNTNLEFQNTGAITREKSLFNSILDGEHILYDKDGSYINLYAAFDAYYINNKDIRNITFWNHPSVGGGAAAGGEVGEPSDISRFGLLTAFIDNLKVVNSKGATSLRIEQKKFYYSDGSTIKGETIFDKCDLIQTKVDADNYEYEVDGLIFTPAHTGVNGVTGDDVIRPTKRTWTASFKWKPPQYNTVDFLVKTKRDDMGNEIVSNVFEDGVNLTGVTNSNTYKTLILCVGYDKKKHGYLNPCNDVIQGKIPTTDTTIGGDEYKPTQFFPTGPTDPNGGITNIMLKSEGGVSYGTQNNLMFIEDESDSFEDNTIVEFRYDMTKEEGWRWIPIRVRHDKTSEFRKGLKNYGNAYHVANSVWRSIHQPITEHMIRTGENIPDELADDDVYYNRSGETFTRPLRDFHNLYVKRKLIMGAALQHRGGTLIDLAVGKAGDLPKWDRAKLKFVYGIDISRDNIVNRMDGACVRYLNYRETSKGKLRALFSVGNSGLNIRSGTAFASSKDKEIVNAVFGVGPKDRELLGNGVYKQYGVANKGFNVVSCQFALHYFFENDETLHNFLRNVSETCALGGYFVGSAYDGKKVFKMLMDKKQNEKVEIYNDEHKIWSLQKMYDNDVFEDDSTSIGYPIGVYQESINKTFTEYLINFTYLEKLMTMYGFELISKEEATRMKLPQSTGLFDKLYSHMKGEVKRSSKMRKEIGRSMELDDEKNLGQQTISFLNRYFVFKKVTDVDAKQVMKLNTSGTSETTVLAIPETIEESEEKAEDEPKLKVSKSKGKIPVTLKKPTGSMKTTVRRKRPSRRVNVTLTKPTA